MTTPNDHTAARDDAAHLYLGNLATVASDISLPQRGAKGSSITWSSSDTRWIDDLGMVHRPQFGRGNRKVRLTASVTFGDATCTRGFEAIVVQQQPEAAILRMLPICMAPAVGEGFHLPAWGAGQTIDGSTLAVPITWNDGQTHRSAQPGTRRYDGHAAVQGHAAVSAQVTMNAEADAGPGCVSPALSPIGIDHIRLAGPGALHADQQRRTHYLLGLDNNRLLREFRVAAGLDPGDAEPMTGWDSPDSLLRGHTTGHVLSAYACCYAATGDEGIHRKLVELVSGLADAQAAFAKQSRTQPGFLSAYDETQFDELERLTPYPTIWAPYYTMHKILAGLVDAHRLGGIAEALDIATALADWVHRRLSRLSYERVQEMWGTYIAGEFGGMNETLADLHAIASDPALLETARIFDNDRLLTPLLQDVDALDGMHANQHIPQVIGYLKLYEQTGLPHYLEAAQRFWRIVTRHHSYAVGGTGEGEMFHAPDIIAGLLSNETAETCATYNMLKLTAGLYAHRPDPDYADYYELATLNHIAASTDHHANGGSTYFLPTVPAGRKSFDITGNTCCHGTGLEAHFRVGEGLCFLSRIALHVGFFTNAVVEDPARGISLRIEVDDTEPERVRIGIARLTKDVIRVHMPWWAQVTPKDPTVMVNGQAALVRLDVSQRQLVLDAANLAQVTSCGWRNDTIDITFGIGLSLLPAPDDAGLASLAWGPYILAALNDSDHMLDIAVDPAPLESSFSREDDERGVIFMHHPSGIRFRPIGDIDENEPYHLYFRPLSRHERGGRG